MLETIVERTQDFTDSAYTSHDHRQNIILLSERARLEMSSLVRLPGTVSTSIMDTEEQMVERSGMMSSAGDNTVMAVRSEDFFILLLLYCSVSEDEYWIQKLTFIYQREKYLLVSVNTKYPSFMVYITAFSLLPVTCCCGDVSII